MDILRLRGLGIGQPAKTVKEGVDFVSQLERIGGLTQVGQEGLAAGRQSGGLAQAVEGGSWEVVAAGCWGRIRPLAHDRVEEVV